MRPKLFLLGAQFIASFVQLLVQRVPLLAQAANATVLAAVRCDTRCKVARHEDVTLDAAAQTTNAAMPFELETHVCLVERMCGSLAPTIISTCFSVVKHWFLILLGIHD